MNTEKTEAMRLADALDAWDGTLMMPAGWRQRASAELRRLNAECNDLAHQLNRNNERNGRIIAQRDALLEALKLAADFLEHSTEFRIGHPGFEGAQAKARAAIKSVEEGK